MKQTTSLAIHPFIKVIGFGIAAIAVVLGGLFIYSSWQQSSSNAGGESSIGRFDATAANNSLIYNVSSDNADVAGLYHLESDKTAKKLPNDFLNIYDASDDRNWVVGEHVNAKTNQLSLAVQSVKTGQSYEYDVQVQTCETPGAAFAALATAVFGQFESTNEPPVLYVSRTTYSCENGAAGKNALSSMIFTLDNSGTKKVLYETKNGSRLDVQNVGRSGDVIALEYAEDSSDSSAFVIAKDQKRSEIPDGSNISGDGKKIAYAKSEDIFVANADGSAAKKVATVGLVSDLKLNFEGTAVAYTSYSENGLKQELHILTITSEKSVYIDDVMTLKNTSQAQTATSFEWAADGSYPAYTKNNLVKNSYDIARVDAAGANKAVLKKFKARDTSLLELYY